MLLASKLPTVFRRRKGFFRGTRGTGDLRDIDNHILKEWKTRRKNVAMTWNECKKSYDIVCEAVV